MIVALERVVGMDEQTGELVAAIQAVTEEGGMALVRSDTHPATYGAVRRHLALIEQLLAEINPEEDNIEDATIISGE